MRFVVALLWIVATAGCTVTVELDDPPTDAGVYNVDADNVPDDAPSAGDDAGIDNSPDAGL